MYTWFKKNLKFLLPVLFVSAFLLLPQTVSAEWWDPFSWAGNAFVDGVTLLLNMVLQAFGLFLALAAFVLELVIDITIVKMRLIIEGGQPGYTGIQAINLAWRAIRDVANILFVFVLLLVSINIILGSWGSGPYNKSLIPKIIIAALLINFSLMFTKVVIDVSNLTAYEFYKAAANIKQRGGGQKLFGVIPTTGLTTSIMNGLSLTRIIGDEGKLGAALEGGASAFTGVSAGVYALFSTLLGIVTILVAAFVLFVMAVMLLVRFVMFIILMITSPIAFIGELLPQLKKHSEKWWKTLADQATFAPVFFVLILVVVLVINDPGFKEGVQGAILATGGGAGAALANLVSVVVQYVIVIGLLIVALVASKQTANMSGNAVAKWTGKAAFGGAAALGRNTLGRVGERMSQSSWLGEQAKSGGFSGSLAKGLLLGGDRLKTSTFDARGIKSVGGDFGEASNKGGLVGARKARTEKLEERGKKYAPAMAIADQKKEIEEKKRALATARDEWTSVDALSGSEKEREAARKKRDDAVADLERAQGALRELQGKGSDEREALAKASAQLTNAQRKEADAAMKVINERGDYIKALRQSAKLELDSAKRKTLEDKADNAERGLNAYRDGLGGSIRSYITAMGDLSKIVKQASGQTSGSQRAYGETLSTGAFTSTRQAGDTLRKSKEKPEEALAKQILDVMKQQESELTPPQQTTGGTPAAPTAPATPATPPATPTPPGP